MAEHDADPLRDELARRGECLRAVAVVVHDHHLGKLTEHAALGVQIRDGLLEADFGGRTVPGERASQRAGEAYSDLGMRRCGGAPEYTKRHENADDPTHQARKRTSFRNG